MEAELKHIQGMACTSDDEIREEIMVFLGYVRKFMAVLEDTGDDGQSGFRFRPIAHGKTDSENPRHAQELVRGGY
jgi:hypothetical protein